MSISVIIPTYKRHDLLRQAIGSVLAQTLLPDEIVIGDDSPDDETERMVTQLIAPSSKVPIRYYHNKPSLKQTKNVDTLFRLAQSELVLLLHDDDLLYPNCLESLAAPFQIHPEIIASFGKQTLIDNEGRDLDGHEQLMKDYFKTADREGLVDGFFAGIVSMFPNDAYLVRREYAVQAGYDDEGESGDAVDYHFGFRLGKLGRQFFFVNEWMAMYRKTTESVSTSGSDSAYRKVKLIMNELRPGQIDPQIAQSLSRSIPIAISIAAKLKDRRNAIKWMLSPYYRNKLLTPRGIKRILMTIKPW